VGDTRVSGDQNIPPNPPPVGKAAKSAKRMAGKRGDEDGAQRVIFCLQGGWAGAIMIP
jgi:hypothetical protein